MNDRAKLSSMMEQHLKNRRAKFAKFVKELVENKDQWIGSQLIDSGDSMDEAMFDSARNPAVTTITDIRFHPKQDTFFEILGETFNCGVDENYGSIDEAQTNDHCIVFMGYMSHKFQIRR